MDFIKYDMTDIWASAGDVVAPDPTKVRAGWGVEIVPRQWWNWFENRQDNNIAYVLQKGIPEWDATTQYIINKSYVQRNGVVYKATATNTNSDPVALTSWIKAFSDSTPFLEAMKGLSVTNSSVPVFNSTGVAAFLSYGATGASVLATTTPTAARIVIDAQQSSSNLTALSGVVANTNKLPYFNGTSTATVTDLTDFGRSLIDDADAVAARTTLGVDSSASVTAALNAGLATKQPLSTALTALSGTTPATNTLPYFTGAGTATTTSITDFGRTILSSADASVARSSLGVDSSATSATNLATRQPLNTNLTSLSSLAGAVDTLPYFSGSNSLALTTLTTKARSLLAKVDTASMQAELALVPVSTPNDTTAGRLLTPGWMGMGTVLGNLLSNANVELPSGKYYTSTDWTGSPITGSSPLNRGYVDISSWGQSGYQCQEFTPLFVATGSPKLFRTNVGGTWRAWEPIVSALTAVGDPATSAGGLMSSALVSGYLVNKYANGDINIRGTAPVTASIAANAITSVTINLPVSLVNGALGYGFSAHVSMAAGIANDHYGVISTSLTSASVISAATRNGPTAQTFTPNINVWGRWK